MSSVRRLRSPRSLLVAVAVAVVLPVLSVAGVAVAEDDVSTGETIVGEFVQVWPEYEHIEESAEHGDEGPLSFLRTEDGETVRLDTEDVEQIEVGATVEVTVGGEVDDTASAEEGYDEAREVLDAEVLEAPPAEPATTAPATAPYTNEVTVVMVKPAGGVRDSRTLAQVVTEVNGNVADFWEAESNGQVRIGVTAQHDWMDTAAGCGNPYALWDEVARRVNFTAGPGKHLLLYLSSTPDALAGCSYGLATVGQWLNWGGYGYVRDVRTSLIAHELGHNFGLGHSSAMQCMQSGYTAPCAVQEYRDYYDVMGASWEQLGSLNVVQAYNHVTSVSSRILEGASPAETITLTPVSQRTGVRTIVLRDHDGQQYFLEFRPASGRDGYLGTPANWLRLQPGVLLRKAADGNDTSLLVDATPSPSSGWSSDVDVALPVATPVRINDVAAGGGAFVVTVQSVSATEAVVHVAPKSGITLAHEASGGDGGVMGPATSAETCADRWGGRYCARNYQNGTIFWRWAGGGAHLLHGPIHTAWTAAGGLNTWGLPTSSTTCGLAAGGCTQKFEYVLDGAVYWSPSTGAFPVSGAVGDLWRAKGGVSSSLGYPTAAQVCAADVCDQPFQGGAVVWRPGRGAFPVQGPVHDTWVAAGGKAGPLGLPLSAAFCGLAGEGCGQHFAGGSVYWSPATGGRIVTGAVRDRWAALGWEAGRLGYPLTDTVCGLADGGCSQRFQGGWLYGSAATPVRYVVGAIGQTWQASGFESGALGYPVTDEICGLTRAGCFQLYQRGAIYWSPQTGARIVSGEVRDRWASLGAQNGGLGYPVADAVCGAPGCTQRFQGGWLSGAAGTGIRAVIGAIGQTWDASGREGGALGHPVMDEFCGLVGSGCFQHYAGGSIYWSPQTGARFVTGALRARWESMGWEAGRLGYPLTNSTCGLTDGGCYQVFQGGSLYGSASTPVRMVTGPTRDAWGATGWEHGRLGYPTTDEWCGLPGGGCFQHFQRGSVYRSAAIGVRVVSGTVRDRWESLGWEAGRLGYPVTDTFCGLVDTGCFQHFQGGSLYGSASTPVHLVLGAIRDKWASSGWEAGRLGYPTTDEICGQPAGGCYSDFQGGSIHWSPATGPRIVTGTVRDGWQALGGPAGALAHPVTDTFCGLVDSGCFQHFQGGSLYGSSRTAVVTVAGPIRDAWAATGWEVGRLGYPTADAVCAAGSCAQAFQGGTINWSAATGARVAAAAPTAGATRAGE